MSFDPAGRPMIPMARPYIHEETRDLVSGVLDSGILARGPMIQQLQREWAQYNSAAHCIAVANGTLALLAAIKAIGVDRGDEIILPSFTFNATAEAVLAAGATPVFADIDLGSYLIDFDAVGEAITKNTTAIIPVDLFGQLVDVYALRRASGFGGFFIEDACQAHGATIGGRHPGQQGADSVVYSLYATKNMAAGEGGLITTDDDDWSAWISRFINHGSKIAYSHTEFGLNYRLNELAAAVALGQLHELDTNNAERINLAGAYDAAFEDLPLRLPHHGTKRTKTHVYHQYTIRFENMVLRELARETLARHSIASAVFYERPVHRQPYWKMTNGREWVGALRNTEIAASTVLQIPIYPGLTAQEQSRVIDAVRKVFE